MAILRVVLSANLYPQQFEQALKVKPSRQNRSLRLLEPERLLGLVAVVMLLLSVNNNVTDSFNNNMMRMIKQELYLLVKRNLTVRSCTVLAVG
jgi:predicted Mrr-cat superfamily restriction endonuclease